MQQPLQIVFHNLPLSPPVEERVRQKIDKLDQLFDFIVSCQVSIEQVQKHQHQGKLYNVHIYVTVPQAQFEASHNKDENLYKAIKEATDNMRLQLEEHSMRFHHQVKLHEDKMEGEVVRLFDQAGFGFIVDPLGEEYYFNEGNVAYPSFGRLKAGTKVRFIPRIGDEGLQARRVTATARR